MKTYLFAILLMGSAGSCTHSQVNAEQEYRLSGGPCEGCEAIFEYGNRQLTSTDTLPGFREDQPKLKLTGTIYEADGLTPAPGVILYIYHTDQTGSYPVRGDETGWGKRHGYQRGWIKTDETGRYTFFTTLPGSYPNRSQPAHIHATVLEPSGRYYWLEDYYFAGDTLLTQDELRPASPRGGSPGVLKLEREENLLVGSRDNVLGKHVVPYD